MCVSCFSSVAGHDALWVEDPDKYGLGEGIVAPFNHPNTPIPKPQNFYVISLLHQLHCLVCDLFPFPFFLLFLFLFQFYFSFHFVLAFLTSIPGFPPTGTVTDPFSFFPSQNIVRYQYYVEKFGDENAEPVKWKVHVEHCFEYLRQAISCGGDLIIEGESPIRVGTGHATSVTGWGVEHDCINFNKLLEFQKLQEARYNQTWQNP